MSEEQTENVTSSELMALAQANNHLAVQLHRLLAEEKGNIFFSPFSISTAIAMVLCAAKDETEAEIRAALGYDAAGIGKDGVITGFQLAVSEFLKTTDSYTLSCANSVLIQKDFEVKDEYKTILSESFRALLLEEDFQSDSESIVSKINDWVKEKTSGMIPSLVQSVDPRTVIMLLNAVYFKGSWLHKFDEALTSQREFYNYGKENSANIVDMMSMKEYFQYADKDSYQALELPYCGDNIAMLILLPKNKDGLEALEQEISASFVHNLAEEMRKGKVIVNLPRFRLKYSKSLVPFFQQLGVNRLFQTGAQLGGANDSSKLEVSDIVHEAVLEVNEEGTEAAAATKITIMTRKAPREHHFIVDHPFLFTIYDKKSKIILFVGRVEEL